MQTLQKSSINCFTKAIYFNAVLNYYNLKPYGWLLMVL